MCGIGGIVRVSPPGGARAPIPDTWLDAIDRCIVHRGPDGHGRYRDVGVRPDGSTVEVALVHRRLAIIDISSGAQPMVSAHGPSGSGSVGVTFNGCIYNHRELRGELHRSGHSFATDHSDTEVLIHGWRAWRESLAEHLDGMFAAGIWDHDEARCAILRDRAGEKPVYYTIFDNGSTIAFASAVPALLAVRRLADPAWSPVPARDAVMEWMFQGWSERLPIRDIEELRPGHTAVFPSARGRPLDLRTNFSLPKRRYTTPHLTVDAMDRFVSESVASRLEADVPIGCFLSGGIDSSLLSYYAKKHLGRLTTLCVRFPDPQYDESEFAAEVAATIGSDHKVIDIHPDASVDLERLIASLGLPFGDSSILPTHWVCRAARDEVKVALSGDGGDELCFGYRRHKAWLLIQRVWPVFLATPRRWPRFLVKRTGVVGRFARFAESIRTLGYRSMLSWQLADIERVVPSQAGRRRRRTIKVTDPSHDDFRAYLPCDLLRKGDTASMLTPLEVRAPLLSNAMIDACAPEPIFSLMRHGEQKGILRDLARRHFSRAITDRRKQGFGVPVGKFFRNDFGGMRTMLQDSLAGHEPFGAVHSAVDIDVAEVRRMVEEHIDGHRDHAARLFSLVSLALWARTLR